MGIFDWKHWIVVLIVVALLFGSRKLKYLGTDVGESIKSFRKAMNDGQDSVLTQGTGNTGGRGTQGRKPARQS